MIPYRYAESLALVPLLHAKPGPTTILIVGPLAPLLVPEALRWRDTVAVWTDTPVNIKDSRIKLIPTNDKAFTLVNTIDVLLLSPEIDPALFAPVLKKGGIMQASTFDENKIGSLREKVKTLTGSAVPWREYVPAPLWGMIGCVGSTPRRVRKPPDGARRVTERFLPVLFSFGKDEVTLIFGKPQH